MNGRIVLVVAPALCGFGIRASTPQEFGARIRSGLEKRARVFVDAGIVAS